MTGEISVQGKVKPVGGVFEKAYGARQAGMKGMIVPADNSQDIPDNHLSLQIFSVSTIQEVLDIMLVK
jgi:ATP-dependent Lon protease